MKGMPITFTKKDYSGTSRDSFGNIIPVDKTIVVEDCLVGPITEPVSEREEQAMAHGKIQVRVHLPKTCTDDVADSSFVYDGKTFTLDSDSVVFMEENCPTRWNRYFRAEAHYE